MLIEKFDEIIKALDPFDLCDGIFCLFSEKYGNKINASIEPEPSRTITLVWHSMGLIGNGGFWYLFEGRFNGDPDFSITAEAYKKIGATSAYKKFNDSLSFYFSRTFFTKLKDWLMNSILRTESASDKILNQCFEEDEEEGITTCLSVFIKNNEFELRELFLKK